MPADLLAVMCDGWQAFMSTAIHAFGLACLKASLHACWHAELLFHGEKIPKLRLGKTSVVIFNTAKYKNRIDE